MEETILLPQHFLLYSAVLVADDVKSLSGFSHLSAINREDALSAVLPDSCPLYARHVTA